jgi:2-polyprenyl-6-methoxyphenol hydroxylase-like FAD-dependent oxidoreductase
MDARGVVVIGAGPVGLIAALRLAQAGHGVTIVARRLPAPDDPPRVDAAPAALLALLVELGIHPASIGAAEVFTRRFVAWSSREPALVDGPATVHIERPALDVALLGALRRFKDVSIEVRRWHPVRDGARAGAIIDASGRAAVTATRRIRPDRPWAARTFWLDRSSCRAAADFAIAALPSGYAYRLGGASRLIVGIVGRGPAVTGTAVDVERRIRRAAPWIMDGLPALPSMAEGAAGAASVQWTEGHSPLRIGDAALARDALASQGVATGASEALLAAAAVTQHDADLIRVRQAEQCQAHLRSLLEAIDQSAYRDRLVWRDYRGFVAANLDAAPAVARVALRDGRIALAS